MFMPFRFRLVAGISSVLLSTSALTPSPVFAAVSADDAGVAMRVQPGVEVAPALRMITRSEIQGERFDAGAFEVVELLLTDGTSLTMAAGTGLTVDRYAYDPVVRQGELAIDMSEGTLRLIGGTLNNAQPITVTTPTATLTLDNATAVIVVDADGTTRAALEFGKSLTVTAEDGDMAEIIKPGFEVIVAADGVIDGPARRPPGAAVQIAHSLNPGLITEIAPDPVLEENATGDGDVADEAEQEVAQLEEETAEAVGDIDDDPQIDDDLTEIAPEAPLFDFGDGGGETGGSDGFGAGVVVGAISLTENQPGINADPVLQLRQDFLLDADKNVVLQDPDGGVDIDNIVLRDPGLTTQSVYLGSEAFSQTLGDADTVGPDIGGDLIYGFNSVFFGDDPDFLSLGAPPTANTNPVMLSLLFKDGEDFVPDTVFEGLDAVDNSEGGEDPDLAVGNTILGIGDDENGQRAPTYVKMLQSGFVNQSADNDSGIGGVVREPDNFIMTQAAPALASEEGRALILQDFERRKEEDGDLAAAKFLVSAFGIGVEPTEDREPDEPRFGFTLSDEETSFLADGLAIALLADDPIAAVEQFLQGSSLTTEEQLLAIEQLERQEQFVFAAGDVDADLDTERRLDIYYISPGLDGFDEDGDIPEGATVASSIRAFLRNATAFREEDGSGGIALGDTGLMIIGTPANSVAGLDTDEQSGLLHADIGLDGEGEDQRSTLSVTIGHVEYDAGATGEEVMLEAHTIGSTQDKGAAASTLAVGDLINSAAGGGRPVDTDGDGTVDENIPGRPTYFVIENVEPVVDDGELPENGANDDNPLAGGSERPMGNPDADTDFAILRLATGKSSIALEPGKGGEFAGVSAGMLETETSGDQIEISPITSEFKLELSPETNRIEVNGNTFDFGGISGQDSKGESVYIDDDRFAAYTNDKGSDLAMVSGKVLQDAAAALPEGNATREFLDVPDYKHLKWGFFFGDTAPVTGENGETFRQHIHLGSWIAGKMADPSRLPNSGKATYKGHAFGNVLNGQALYAAKGTYKNEWNFGTGAGLVTMGFDGAKLQGLTKLEDGTVAFVGSIKGDDRDGIISGVFIQGKKNEKKPAAQLGQFQIQGKKYNAVGTFGGERGRKK